MVDADNTTRADTSPPSRQEAKKNRSDQIPLEEIMIRLGKES